jgi:nucleoside diphosphate kinase
MMINPRSRKLLSKIITNNVAQRSMTTKFPGESTFGLIKPDGISHLSEIFDIIFQEGFYIRQLRMSKYTNATAKVFYEEHLGSEYFAAFREYMISGPVIGLRLGRLDAVKHWRDVIGNYDPEVAKLEAPESIRARFGTNQRVNVVHGADSTDNAQKEMNLYFGNTSLLSR